MAQRKEKNRIGYLGMTMNEQTDQMMIEVYSHALIHGTGFLKLAMTPQGIEWSVVDPDDYRYLIVPPPPQEAQSEAEKTAYTFGWFKAMEAQRMAKQWGASAVDRPEYIAEQERRTQVLRSIVDQIKESGK